MEETIIHKVIEYCRKYGFGWRSDLGERHAFKVRELALEIFDNTIGLHKMDKYERLLLETASLLHDIGRYKSDENHHIESRNMILESRELREILKPRDIKIIAWTIFFHRRNPDPLKYSDREWNKIKNSRKIYETIVKLASILRIADALDRSLRQIIRKIDIKKTDNKLVFQLHATENIDIEINRACKKADLFKKLFKIDIEFTPSYK